MGSTYIHMWAPGLVEVRWMRVESQPTMNTMDCNNDVVHYLMHDKLGCVTTVPWYQRLSCIETIIVPVRYRQVLQIKCCGLNGLSRRKQWYLRLWRIINLPVPSRDLTTH
jgi:hypothetical protein